MSEVIGLHVRPRSCGASFEDCWVFDGVREISASSRICGGALLFPFRKSLGLCRLSFGGDCIMCRQNSCRSCCTDGEEAEPQPRAHAQRHSATQDSGCDRFLASPDATAWSRSIAA